MPRLTIRAALVWIALVAVACRVAFVTVHILQETLRVSSPAPTFLTPPYEVECPFEPAFIHEFLGLETPWIEEAEAYKAWESHWGILALLAGGIAVGVLTAVGLWTWPGLRRRGLVAALLLVALLFGSFGTFCVLTQWSMEHRDAAQNLELRELEDRIPSGHSLEHRTDWLDR